MLKGSIRQARSGFEMDMKQKTLSKCYVQNIKITIFSKKKNILHFFVNGFAFLLDYKKNYVPLYWLSLALYTFFVQT